MAVLAGASGSARDKLDSTGVLGNMDDCGTTGTNATIQPVAHVSPGGTCYRVHPVLNKTPCHVANGFPTSTSELVICAVITPWVASAVDYTNMTEQAFYWMDSGVSYSRRFKITAQKIGTSTTTSLWTLYYDNVSLGTYTVTMGHSYRVHVYLKLGTLGVANSTVAVYIDDVTSADIAVGAATNIVNNTTVTMTNTPAWTSIACGTLSGGTMFGSVQYDIEHWSVIDTAAGDPDAMRPDLRALDPICVSLGAFPTAQGADNGWTASGTYADVDETPPDDATTKVEGAIAFGGAPIDVTYAVSDWGLVGNSDGDQILAVAPSWRGRSADGVHAGQAHLRGILREGGTDHIAGGSVAVSTTWTTEGVHEIAAYGWAQTPPTTGGVWTPALFDATEPGIEAYDGGFILAGNTAHPQLTQIRLQAVFIKKPSATPPAPDVPVQVLGGKGPLLRPDYDHLAHLRSGATGEAIRTIRGLQESIERTTRQEREAVGV